MGYGRLGTPTMWRLSFLKVSHFLSDLGQGLSHGRAETDCLRGNPGTMTEHCTVLWFSLYSVLVAFFPHGEGSLSSLSDTSTPWALELGFDDQCSNEERQMAHVSCVPGGPLSLRQLRLWHRLFTLRLDAYFLPCLLELQGTCPASTERCSQQCLLGVCCWTSSPFSNLACPFSSSCRSADSLIEIACSHCTPKNWIGGAGPVASVLLSSDPWHSNQHDSLHVSLSQSRSTIYLLGSCLQIFAHAEPRPLLAPKRRIGGSGTSARFDQSASMRLLCILGQVLVPFYLGLLVVSWAALARLWLLHVPGRTSPFGRCSKALLGAVPLQVARCWNFGSLRFGAPATVHWRCDAAHKSKPAPCSTPPGSDSWELF